MTITRTANPRAEVTKLEVVEVPDEDAYTYVYTPRCLACDPVDGRVLPLTAPLATLGAAVLQSTSSAHKAEVQAWEEELVACTHTEHLPQEPSAPLDLAGAGCAECGLTSNLWLCITCGHLGCGRAQFGGVQGNGHGLAHYTSTGHPASVKQGTITADGHADVYCYACDDTRLDPALRAHLAHFGMHMDELTKTEKSMTELQLEHNARFDFAMTGQDGQSLEPLYGPGHTGLRNLGNSCYLASVVQALFALPSFQQRYSTQTHAAHVAVCPQNPADCLECQLGKLADGLYSGRYAVPNPAATEHPAFQAGIRPAMLKTLLGRGHPEFSTMRQQDAEEFLQFLVQQIHAAPHPTADPTAPLSYALEHRLECTQCHKVRYTEEMREAGIALPVPVVEHEPNGAERVFEPVRIEASLAQFCAPETIPYHCPACRAEVAAEKQTRFKTFPDVLIVQAQRFQLVNWVPQKVNVPFEVPITSALDVSSVQAHGLQPGEDTLPDEEHSPALSTLTAMGFSENRARRALEAANNDPEAGANWLFERMDDASLDLPLGGPDTSMLEEMGFTRAQASKALRLQGNPEAAVAWLFDNPNDPGEEAMGDAAALPGSPTPFPYRLASFVTHRGPSVHSGHYVAHVHQPPGWTFFNDEKVVRAPPDAADEASVDRTSKLYVPKLTSAYLYTFVRSD